MIRGIGLSDAGMQPRQVLREDKVKGRVWKTVAAWVSYALRQGQSFKTVLVSSICEGIECSFSREHRLIVIGVEVTPDHDRFNRWHFSSDHVVDVRQELSNGDFTLLTT